MVDIECTDLRSDSEFIICCGIKELGKPGKIVGLADVERGPDRNRIDMHLITRVRDELEKFDGWITWNGLLFDIPFIDDRLLFCGQRPRATRFARGLDMMWHARQGKSRMSSSKLDNVAKALKCPYKKTMLEKHLWKDAEDEAIAWRRGVKLGKAYQYIAKHCLADLQVTEWVYQRLLPRVMTISKR